MKFQTLSLVTGTAACNASCPFCVSKMTYADNIDIKEVPINFRNFEKTLRLAQIGNVSTVIFTGKGEPFLYPQQLVDYLEFMQNNNYSFPFMEIQTNGELLTRDNIGDWNVDELLGHLYNLGVTSILVSNVGPDAELNHQIYYPRKSAMYDMQHLVDKVQKFGINVRLTTVGIKGGVDSVAELDKLVEWAKFLNVKQLTWRPVNEPGTNYNLNDGVSCWVKSNHISTLGVEEIVDHVVHNGSLIYKLVHGAAVYDYKGMNLCLTNSLTQDPAGEVVRQLIFYPDGSLYTDWAKKGSVLL